MSENQASLVAAMWEKERNLKSIIDQINSGEITIILQNRKGVTEPLLPQLIKLLELGEIHQKLLDECAGYFQEGNPHWKCCDKSCRGHDYCKAYRLRWFSGECDLSLLR